ncbi:hypothetical protein [Thiocapsa marina]|uniref:hypothetical protein n=1 Tax=Thiocapsa marina TaxID=244573 RepID=UPI001305241E|nr:hypothetical protein [Thiocapsa marina]
MHQPIEKPACTKHITNDKLDARFLKAEQVLKSHLSVRLRSCEDPPQLRGGDVGLLELRVDRHQQNVIATMQVINDPKAAALTPDSVRVLHTHFAQDMTDARDAVAGVSPAARHQPESLGTGG